MNRLNCSGLSGFGFGLRGMVYLSESCWLIRARIWIAASSRFTISEVFQSFASVFMAITHRGIAVAI